MNMLKSMLSDGTGETSHSRVIMFLVALAIIVPKVIVAIKNGDTVHWSEADLYALGVVIGGGVLKTVAEGVTDKTTKTNP